MDPNHEPEPLLNVSEVATRLGVPTSWVYSQAEAGKLPSYRLGKYRRFRWSEIERFLSVQR